MNKILLLLLLLVSITQSESVERGVGIAAETNPAAQPLASTESVARDRSIKDLSIDYLLNTNISPNAPTATAEQSSEDPLALLSIDHLLNSHRPQQQKQITDAAPNPTAQPLVLTENVARSRRDWTNEEDAMLLDLVNKYGRKWGMASKMLDRTPKQCRERWTNYLNLEINKDQWTTEEDQNLRMRYNQMGPQWTVIANMMPGKTCKQCRERFNCLLMKKSLNHSADIILQPPRQQQPLNFLNPNISVPQQQQQPLNFLNPNISQQLQQSLNFLNPNISLPQQQQQPLNLLNPNISQQLQQSLNFLNPNISLPQQQQQPLNLLAPNIYLIHKPQLQQQPPRQSFHMMLSTLEENKNKNKRRH